MARETLRTYRLEKKMTLRELAKRSGTNAQMVSFLERNLRDGSFKMWKQIQNSLEIPSSEMWNIINENK